MGSVFATERTGVPRALGGDLGGGTSALRIGVDAGALGRRELEAIVQTLGRAIPTGDAVHRGRGVDVPDTVFAPPLSTRSLEHTRDALARRHLGTLGGGNHFLELDRDPEGALWLLVHSGSRGLGAAVAAHHAKVASASESDDLAGLDIEGEEAPIPPSTMTRRSRERPWTRQVPLGCGADSATRDHSGAAMFEPPLREAARSRLGQRPRTKTAGELDEALVRGALLLAEAR